MLGLRKSLLLKLLPLSLLLVVSGLFLTFKSENFNVRTHSTEFGLGNNETIDDDTGDEILNFINQESLSDSRADQRRAFFQSMFHIIKNLKPSINPLDEYLHGKCGVQMVDNEEYPLLTHDELLKYLQVSDEDVKELKLKHSNFVELLPKEYPKNIYESNSNGIVYVGGNKFTWLTLISIMNIRQRGCNLPVEILIPKYEEYELNICKNVFPKYHAKCIYLPKLVGDEITENYNLKGYQYKSLAIALSSFENVLLLDADNTALTDPTVVFESSPFIESGLVLWPDFWKRTTHPKFYDIINKKIDLTNRRSFGYKEYGENIKQLTPNGEILFHQLENTLPDPTTESGQVLISKSKHFNTILLSLYYNTYGPDYYYPLLSQGAAGEGDKETFLAAAHALNNDYYAVKKHVIALGRFRNGEFYGSAMGQFNPIEDFKLLEKYKNLSIKRINQEPKLLFLHANFPKLDPWSLYKDDVIINSDNNQRNRLFGKDFIKKVNYDFELKTWMNMKILLCDEKFEFTTFKNEGVSSELVCNEVLNHINFLRSDV